MSSFTFIDLFAGLGGFHYALHKLGGNCIAVSEIDKFARITYEANYKKSSPSFCSIWQFFVVICSENQYITYDESS